MTVAIIGASGFVGSRLRNRFLGQNTACTLFDKNPK
jgi:nucleoside-diphosphate-sugar epimerase